MTEELKEILENIKGEIHLSKILHPKIKNPLIARDYSLLDIYLLENDYFVKIEGLGIGKLNYLNEFKDQVNTNPLFFEHYYHYIVQAPIEIGQFYAYKSVAHHVLKCLEKITAVLQFKTELPVRFFDKTEYNSFLPLSNYITDYFGLNTTQPLTFKEIGLKYNKSSELIRVTLFDNKKRPSLCDLFLNNEEGFGLQINSNLIHIINSTIESQFYKSSFLKYFDAENEFDIEIIRKIIEIFKLELIEVTFEDSINNYYTIVNKEEAAIYRAHLIILDSLFRDGDAYNKKTIIEKLAVIINNLNNTPPNKLIKKHGINNAILEVLLVDSFKIEVLDSEEEQLYQFKWKYLSSVNAKVERILFEHEINMHKTEIFNEYNIRANESNIELIPTVNELFIKRSKKIKPIGKLGRWYFSDTEDDGLQETIEKFIDKSIVEVFNGKISFNELKQYIAISPYSLYPDSNLRTNLFLCCRKAIHDDDLFIHQDFLSEYPEIKTQEKRNRYLGNAMINIIVKIISEIPEKTIEKNELKNRTLESLKREGFTINRSSNYYAYLSNFNDIGIVIKKEINGTTYYSIDEEELKNHNLEKLGKKAEPEYKKNIRSHAISYLKEIKRMKLSDLKEEVKHLMPKDISYSNFYRIFQDTEIFVKEQIGTDLWVSLETSLLPVPQDLHVEVQEEATELLGTTILTERVRYDVNKLKSEIINELFLENNTYKMSKEELSLSFDIFNTTLSNENGEISKWGDSLMQSLYELLCTKTDYYDREACLNKLITGYETYLKCFTSNTEYISFSGQAEVIHHFASISELRTYKDIDKHYRTDVQKTNFSYILSRIKYLSDISRHDKMHESLDMGLNKQIKNAIDFIALYLYSGYLIKIEQLN